MFNNTLKTTILSAIASMLLLTGLVAQAAEHKLDISLETGPGHLRNLQIVKFAERLEKDSGGKLNVRVFHGAAKYKGANVPTALAQGALDMGVPMTLHLSKFIPEFNLPGLPMFYGSDRHDHYKVFDGPVGQELVERLEKKLPVKVIGKWIDLGAGHMFFAEKAVKKANDINGMKLRSPGGAANMVRLGTFNAAPVKIPLPDLAQALQRKTVDGVQTTFESMRSVKLWDSGIKYGFVNNETFYQYVPVVSMRAWKRLPKDLQDLIIKTWAVTADDMREFAAEKQNKAREIAQSNGVTVIDGDPSDLAQAREKLLTSQDELVKELRMDPEVVEKAKAALAK